VPQTQVPQTLWSLEQEGQYLAASSRVAPIPANVLVLEVAEAWTTASWPVVTRSPMAVGRTLLQAGWSRRRRTMAPSWTFVSGPMPTLAASPLEALPVAHAEDRQGADGHIADDHRPRRGPRKTSAGICTGEAWTSHGVSAQAWQECERSMAACGHFEPTLLLCSRHVGEKCEGKT